MQKISELTLPYLPMDEASFAENPWPHFDRARGEHPWLANCPYGLVVTQFEAMRDLLYQDRYMRGAYESVVDIMGARGTSWGRFQLESLLAQTGESHQRIRKVLAPAFTPQQANKHRALMRATIDTLLDEWVPKDAFDFEEFASMFPITVFCALVGASPDVIPGLRASLETFGMSVSLDKTLLPKLVNAMDTLDAFVQKLVARRRANRLGRDNEDLLEILVRTADDEGNLSDRELYDLLIFLFVAGFDTSKNALTLMMDTLIDRPEMYRRCAEDQGYCRKVVEEMFRYVTTSTIPRLVTRDLEYRDVLIPEGTVLFFPVSVSGRDPAIERGTQFDPERENTTKHIAFGMGVHICMGQFIARAQIEEGLHQIARRIRNPRRTGPSGWRPFFGVWGMIGLPIAFDQAKEMEPA
ncbi:MAG: cytochrome P450 [Novosphingobium sp.]